MESKHLPSRDVDEVLTLYAHYFLASDLMLKNYKKLLPNGISAVALVRMNAFNFLSTSALG